VNVDFFIFAVLFLPRDTMLTVRGQDHVTDFKFLGRNHISRSTGARIVKFGGILGVGHGVSLGMTTYPLMGVVSVM